jgi:hypothetical protein
MAAFFGAKETTIVSEGREKTNSSTKSGGSPITSNQQGSKLFIRKRKAVFRADSFRRPYTTRTPQRGRRQGLHRSTSQRRTRVSAPAQIDALGLLEQCKSEGLGRPLYKGEPTTPLNLPKQNEGPTDLSRDSRKYSPIRRPRCTWARTTPRQDSPECIARNSVL